MYTYISRFFNFNRIKNSFSQERPIYIYIFVFFPDVEDGFMPWLMREVKKEIGHMVESREVLMGKYP